jgi:hypothetical protein
MAITEDTTGKELDVHSDETSNAISGEGSKTPSDAATTSTDTATRAAAKGTLSTLILRLISFGCTQLTIRALDPSTLGTNIQLELLLTTVLFISREGFRLALTQNVVAETWTVGSITDRMPSNFVRILCYPSQTL